MATQQYKILRYDPSAPDTPAIVQNDDVTIGIIGNQLAVNDQGINTNQLADLGVTTGKIGDNQVTTAKLALDSVDATILADNAVDTNAIQDVAVTTAKLALASVDATILAANSVTDTAVADGSVTALKILSSYVPVNYTPVAVGAEGTDRVSSALKGIDQALGAISSGTTWLALAKVWSADASLNAVGVGGTGNVTVPLSDDTTSLLPFANWVVGDYLLSYNGAGTDIVFQVTALPGPDQITVTSVGVHQPVEGNMWPVSYDLHDNAQNIPVGQSIYGFSSTVGHFVKIGDVNFEVATGITLSAAFTPIDSQFPAALDSVEVAIEKLSGNDNITTAKLQDAAVTTGKMALASVDETIIASSALSDGLTGGSGSKLKVLASDASITSAVGGISVNLDPAGAIGLEPAVLTNVTRIGPLNSPLVTPTNYWLFNVDESSGSSSMGFGVFGTAYLDISIADTASVANGDHVIFLSPNGLFKFFVILAVDGVQLTITGGEVVAPDANNIWIYVTVNTGDTSAQNALALQAALTADATFTGQGITAVPTFSLSGIQVNVDGTSIDINANNIEVKDGGISAAKLGVVTDGTTLDQSGPGGTIEIAPLGVGTAQLADNSVTIAKIGDLTDGVTVDQNGAGSSIQVMDSGITTAKLADGAVTYEKLSDDVHASLGQQVVVAGYDASAGDIVYIKNDDSKAYLATADVASNCPGLLYYVSVGGLTDANITLIEDGLHPLITYEVGQSFEPAHALYLSAVTAGAMTHVAPTSPGNQVIIVGYAATVPSKWEMEVRKIASL